MDKTLKCRYCTQTTTVPEDVKALLVSAKNSKGGSDICKKWGHSFVEEKNKK